MRLDERRTICLAGVAWAAAGCGVLGADDYHLVDRSPDSCAHGSALDVCTDEVGLPLLPAQPDSVCVDACEDCAATECRDQRDECLASERCKALLWCHGQCSDPSCTAKCRDTYPESPLFDRYFNCVFNKNVRVGELGPCATDCGAGRNVECHGAYEWTASPGASGPLDVETQAWSVLGAGPVGGFPYAEFGTCEDRYEAYLQEDAACTFGSAAEAYGGASVGLGSGPLDALGMKDVGARYRIYDRPLDPGVSMRLLLPDVAYAHELRAQIGTWEPSSGLVFVIQTDCLGALQGAQLSISVSSSRDEQIRPWHADKDGFPSAEIGETVFGVGGFANVPAGSGIVIRSDLPDVGSGAWVSRTVVVAPGWMTVVRLYPYAVRWPEQPGG